MLKNISSTFFVMVVAMLSSFVVTILLGRTLDPNDFGEFSLLKQILLIGSTVAVFGLDYSYIKNFARQGRVPPKTHWLTLMIFAGVSLGFTLVIWMVYDLSVTKLLWILSAVFFGAVNFYLASIERLKDRFFLAQVFAHGWKFVLLILVTVFLFFDVSLNTSYLYPLFSLSLFVGSTFMVRYLFADGQESMPRSLLNQYLTFGVMFWLINATGLISGGIDKLVIPLLYGSDTLGNYAAVSFLFLISLTMVGSAIGYVIFPKISSGERINARKWMGIVLLICMSAIVFYHYTGAMLVSFIFGGKYDHHVTPELVLIFSLLGSLQIIHTILHFIISARGSERDLLVYWAMTLVFILLFVVFLVLGKVDPGLALMRVAGIVLLTRLVKVLVMAVFLLGILRRKAIGPASTAPGVEVT